MLHHYHRLLLGCLLLLARPATAQLTPQLAQSLQHELELARTQYNAHGLSAAVLLPDQTVWTGVAGVSTSAPVDSLRPDHLLGVGSITKTFTSALVLRLVAQGIVGLDDSIARHVPQVLSYPNIDPGVTVRQLLNHTGGVYNYTNNTFFGQQINQNPNRIWQPANMLNLANPMRFTPGTAWEYSNTGYVLLGLLVEAKTGLTISQAYHQLLLTPHGLPSTWLGYNDTLPTGMVAAHGWIQSTVGGPFSVDLGLYSRNAIFSSAYAAGALMSTPADLVRWAHILYADTLVLSQAWRDSMETVSPLSPGQLPYGLGVMRTNRSGRVMWGHNGSIPGYMATFGYVPTCGVAVAVMVNESNPVTEATTNRLFGIVNSAVCNVQSLAEELGLVAPGFYPNPAREITTLRYACRPEIRCVSLVVYDALGRLARTQPLAVNATETELDLTGLTAGIYTARLLTDGQPGPATRLVVRP